MYVRSKNVFVMLARAVTPRNPAMSGFGHSGHVKRRLSTTSPRGLSGGVIFCGPERHRQHTFGRSSSCTRPLSQLHGGEAPAPPCQGRSGVLVSALGARHRRFRPGVWAPTPLFPSRSIDTQPYGSAAAGEIAFPPREILFAGSLNIWEPRLGLTALAEGRTLKHSGFYTWRVQNSK